MPGQPRRSIERILSMAAVGATVMAGLPMLGLSAQASQSPVSTTAHISLPVRHSRPPALRHALFRRTHDPKGQADQLFANPSLALSEEIARAGATSFKATHATGASSLAATQPNHRVRRTTSCPNNKWVGFNFNNKDINAFYDGSTNSSGPNGCDTTDQTLNIPSTSQNVPPAVTVPAGTTATVNAVINVTAPSGCTPGSSCGSLLVSCTETATNVWDTCVSGAAVGRLDDGNGYDITVNGGTMQVAPGSFVYMQSNALYVKGATGNLQVEGTIQGPKSVSASPGWWQGVDVQPGASATFNKATIVSGGSGVSNNLCSDCENRGAILAEGSANVSVTGGTIGSSGQNDIEAACVGGHCPSPTIKNISFNFFLDQNPKPGPTSGFPIRYDYVPGDLSNAIGGLTGTGYQLPAISMPSGTATVVGTWPNAGLPYETDPGELDLTATNLTLAAGDLVHIQGELQLKSASTLVAQARSTLYMEGAVVVNSGNTLNLSGTSKTSMVTVTSVNDYSGAPGTASPGDYGGVDYQSGSSGTDSYSTFKYGGYYQQGSGNSNLTAGVAVEGTAAVTITNSTILDSSANGVEVDTNATPTLTNDSFVFCTNCSIGSNNGTAVQFDDVPGNLTSHISGLTSSGYLYNTIGIGSGSYSGTGTWPFPTTATCATDHPYDCVVYQLTDDLPLSSAASLTFAAGDEVLNSTDSIYAGSGSTLNLAGTASNPVVFTSVNDQTGASISPQPGDWGGIAYLSGSTGSISNATFKFGGYYMSQDNSMTTELAIQTSKAVSVTGSTFLNSSYNGIEINNPSAGTLPNPMLTADTATYCTSCNYSTNNGAAFQYDFPPGNLTKTVSGVTTPIVSGLAASGYGNNVVGIEGGQTATYSAASGTWPNSGLPYLITDAVTIAGGAALTIPASDTIRMTGSLYIDSNGALTLAGTALQPVVFTSSNDYTNHTAHPGDWGGIDCKDGSTCSIQYTNFRYGGYYATGSYANGDLTAELNIEKTKTTSTVTNSSFGSSSADDVDVTDGAAPTFRQDSFGAVPSNSFTINNLDSASIPSSSAKVNATDNYWGSANGPAVGTNLTTAVNFKPFYTAVNRATSPSAGSTATAQLSNTDGTLSAAASGGTSGIELDTLSAMPVATPPSGTPLDYFDTPLAPDATFSSLVISDCENVGSQVLLWWNGTQWALVGNVNHPPTLAGGCITATIDNSSSPTLQSLLGATGKFPVFVAALLPTKTGLASSSTGNTSTYGQSVTLTATVTANGTTPTGSVVFKDGNASLATVNLSNGTAQKVVTNFKAATHNLTATFTATSGSGLGNSASSTVKQIVKPASLTITAANKSGVYTQALAALTWTGTGFVNGETAASLTTQPTCKTTAAVSSGKITSPAGTYPITCSGAVDANYTFTYVAGKLTVKAAPVVLKYTGPTTVTKGTAATFTGTIKTQSGMGIKNRKLTFTLGTGSTAQKCTSNASTSTGGVSCKLTKVTVAKGTEKLKVAFAGDPTGTSDFYAAASITKSLTVK